MQQDIRMGWMGAVLLHYKPALLRRFVEGTPDAAPCKRRSVGVLQECGILLFAWSGAAESAPFQHTHRPPEPPHVCLRLMSCACVVCVLLCTALHILLLRCWT